ncbi:hypothetical protein [Nocardia huaxiensis]|uniref:hypothetical protein n=1 Tax=Nocardia huaxiensis TaxID=2755382 RepID=UPI001E3BC20F|nr:hypothetical protein [Nocardia huaxiensis]UFS93261.1 hypothetical protein LPY97_20645 [Nocardia huaxiensis]
MTPDPPTENLAEAILRILDRRGIHLSNAHRARISSGTNLELMDLWLIATIADQFADQHAPESPPET